MSMLEEILSSIKRESPSGDVPPNLRRIVLASTTKQRSRKRAILISIFAVIMVGIGFGAILFFERVPSRMVKSEDSGKVLQALQGLKTESLQDISVQRAATINSPQSPPLPPNPSVESAAPVRESAAGLVEHSKKAMNDRGQGPETIGSSLPRNQRMEGENVRRAVSLHTNVEKEEASPTGKTERDLHLYTAKSYESAGDFGRAQFEYKKALELDRENYMILNNLAGVLIRLGLYQDAGSYAERSLALKKDYVPSLINLAIARLKTGQAEEGMKYLSQALQLAPTDRATLSNLAVLHEKAGEYGKAYDFYRRLAAMDDVDGQLGMARVCEKENRAKEAEAIYRNILKKDLDKKVKKLASERLAALGSTVDVIR